MNSYLRNLSTFLADYENKKTIQKDALKYYKAIVRENNEPRYMYVHTRERIYPAIATFKALMDNGYERKESAEIVNEYYRFRARKSAKALKKVVKLPLIKNKIITIMSKATSSLFNDKHGFDVKVVESNKKRFRFDIVACPYYQICERYDAKEIVAGFCEADEICYGDLMNNFSFKRSQTIGKGGDKCDFDFEVKD